MLRELQEQIKLLEARLAGQPTVDAHGNMVEVVDGQDKVVYKERIITQGVSEEELMAMREKTEGTRALSSSTLLKPSQNLPKTYQI